MCYHVLTPVAYINLVAVAKLTTGFLKNLVIKTSMIHYMVRASANDKSRPQNPGRSIGKCKPDC